MKIELNNETNMIRFDELARGDAFFPVEGAKILCIKTGDFSDYYGKEYNSVCLRDGSYARIADYVYVRRAKVKIVSDD